MQVYTHNIWPPIVDFPASEKEKGNVPVKTEQMNTNTVKPLEMLFCYVKMIDMNKACNQISKTCHLQFILII